jgi:rhomboid protease GluP
LISLNFILLFIASASSLILLLRIAQLRNPRNRGWRIAAIAVLAVCTVGGFLAPSLAGYVGGTFWCLLLVLPSVAERQIDAALLEQRFVRARRIALVRRLFHPWEDLPYRASVLRAMELAAKGELTHALDLLAKDRDVETPAGRFATALTFALTENWRGLVQWCRRDLSLTTNPAVYSLYLRALGEVGALDDLVFEVAARLEGREPEGLLNGPAGHHFALVLAFSGATEQLMKLYRGRLGRMPFERQQFWIATAELAEGKVLLARQRLEKIAMQTGDAVLRRSVERRLASPVVAALSGRGEMLLARLITESYGAQAVASGWQLAGAPAVCGLILINLAMFVVEIMLGGATDSQTLHFLGALEPDAVLVRHEYWRLLTALFLHYGVLHIAFNLYALYLLGPELERLIGSVRFILGYLLAGLGSSLGVVLLRTLNLTAADELVGASGCIMGVIGISAGLLLRHRQSPLAGRRLRNILLIVILQTIFDLSTPQVSLAAHLSGFVSGVLLGLLLASLPRPIAA